jgi:maleylpyruvate isomerase
VLLLETLDGLDDERARAASTLPDWTVGHVVTHLARNADAFTGQFEAAGRGEVAQMYPGGVEQRAGDIERGAGRSAADLVADVRTATARLEDAWAATTPEAWQSGKGRAGDREFALAFLPFRRWREVEVHHADLGLAFTPDDWSDAYVARELGVTAEETAERVKEGTLVLVATDLGERWMIGSGPATEVAAPARGLLAWLLGRIELPDTPPLLAWQREHRR